MDRGPLLRKAGLAAAGLVVLGGAVFALRSPEQPGTSHPQDLPPQTSVAKFAAKGVVLPEPGAKPPAPVVGGVVPGPSRLLLRWTGPGPGYEVRWGLPGALTDTRLVTEPQVQLDGLTDGTGYDVEVRTVDSFGQRSAPLRISAKAGLAQPDPLAYAFVDRFDGPSVPDPHNWAFASPGGCGRATRGDGTDTKRLVVSGNCGVASSALRARAPVKLTTGPDRGGVVIDTDAPGEAGQLMIDLVPGAADLIDGSPSGPPKPGKPGVAQADPALPPGTIRVLITSTPEDRSHPTPGTTVQVLTAPNVRHTKHVLKVEPIPAPHTGENVRWQVTIGKDTVAVLRNGVLVGAGDVTASWSQATALFGFTGPSGGFRAGMAMIGFTGAATAPPGVLATPNVHASRTVQQTGMLLKPAPAGAPVAGVESAQLRMSLLPQAEQKLKSLDGTLTVDIGGKRVLAKPAVAGQPLTRGVRYPVVASIPKEALIVSDLTKSLEVDVSSNVQQKGLATRVESTELELIPAPGSTPPAMPVSTERPLPRPHPAVARTQAQMLGATGDPLEEGATAVPGRVLVDVHLDGPAAQRIAGEVAGLGGIEIRLDGRKIAAFPTTVDGPGIGGQWRLPLTTNQFGTGPHIIEVRAVGVDAATLYASTVLSFTV